MVILSSKIRLSRYMLSIFVSAIEDGCGWHKGKSFHHISHLINLESSTWLTSYSFFIVHQGMKDHVPGEMTFMKSNRARWRDVIHRVKLWVYSWMRPGYVETEEEYKISKFLLLQFVCSPSFLSAAKGKMFVVIAMLRFLQKHVLFMSVCIAITWDDQWNIAILPIQQLMR